MTPCFIKWFKWLVTIDSTIPNSLVYISPSIDCPLCYWHLLGSLILGARGYITSRYIVIWLWLFRQFIQPETSGYMLSFFRMHLPLWSQYKQWIHADHFYKENTKVTSGHFLNENSGFFHNYDYNVSSGYFLKAIPGFFHTFVHNVAIMGLSHSLRLLSEYIQEYN